MTFIPSLILVGIAPAEPALYLQQLEMTIPPSEAILVPERYQDELEGSINGEQLQQLEKLEWPQTYRDIINTFGYPYNYSDTEDFYQVEGTENQWVVIEYEGDQAVGYRIEKF
jgi:hypothetical protein